MCNLLFNQRSRGSVTLKSADPADNPVVDHNYLSDPLDMLVMTEACVFANEMVMRGRGTQGCVKGSWPAHLTHHTHSTRDDWIPHVKEHATTCKSHTYIHSTRRIMRVTRLIHVQATTPAPPAPWAPRPTPMRSSTRA